MLNKLVVSIVAGLLLTASSTVFGGDLVSATFTRIDKDAISAWHNKPAKGADEKVQALAESAKIKEAIAPLKPAQLVERIRRSKQKIHEIPSDSKHQRYFGYFESVINFSIMRLGDQKTPEAKQALEEVKPIISGAASLMETWDEANKNQ